MQARSGENTAAVRLPMHDVRSVLQYSCDNGAVGASNDSAALSEAECKVRILAIDVEGKRYCDGGQIG
jgi:hypothetical protein